MTYMYMEVVSRSKKTRQAQEKFTLTKGDRDWIEQHFASKEENEKAHDRIFLKLIEHDQKMDTFVTKDEFYVKMDEMNGRFDEMFGVLKDIRQEQAAFVLSSSRHEEKIEIHDVDIKKIKQHIHIS